MEKLVYPTILKDSGWKRLPFIRKVYKKLSLNLPKSLNLLKYRHPDCKYADKKLDTFQNACSNNIAIVIMIGATTSAHAITLYGYKNGKYLLKNSYGNRESKIELEEHDLTELEYGPCPIIGY